MRTLFWLYAVWQLRREYRRKGALFSYRMALVQAARPRYAGGPLVIDYPDAFFFLTPADVKRARTEVAEDRARRIAEARAREVVSFNLLDHEQSK